MGGVDGSVDGSIALELEAVTITTAVLRVVAAPSQWQ